MGVDPAPSRPGGIELMRAYAEGEPWAYRPPFFSSDLRRGVAVGVSTPFFSSYLRRRGAVGVAPFFLLFFSYLLFYFLFGISIWFFLSILVSSFYFGCFLY